jgi:hypothetical protein
MFVWQEPKYFTKMQNLVKIATYVIEKLFKFEIKENKLDRFNKVKDIVENRDNQVLFHEKICLNIYINLFLDLKSDLLIRKLLGDDRVLFDNFLKFIKEWRNGIAHNKIEKIEKSDFLQDVLIMKLLLKLLITINEGLVKKKYCDFVEKLHSELESEVLS